MKVKFKDQVLDLPDNATYQDAEKAYNAQYGSPKKTGELPGAPDSGFTAKNIARNVLGQGLGLGFGDEIEAGVRTLGGLRGDYKATRDQIRAENKAYEEANPVASTVGEIAGGILPAFATGGASLGATGARLGANLGKSALAKGAATGAAYGGATGAGKASELENVGEEALGGAALGGVTGGLLGGITKGLGAPKLSDDAQKLKEMGVTNLTPGQLLGPAASKAESALSALPFAGSITNAARQEAYKSFQKGVMDKVLKPLGIDLPKDKQGRDLVNNAYEAIGKKYDEITPKLKLDTNKGGFLKEFDDVFLGKDSAVSHLGLQNRQQLLTQANDILLQNAKNGKLEGEAFRRVEKDFNKAAKSYFSKGEQEMGAAMQDALNAFRDGLEKQNAGIGGELKKIHKAFREFLPIERASALGGAEGTGGGIISPQALASGSRGIGGIRAFGKGRAPLQDEAELGARVLGKETPSSGTAERTFIGNAISNVGKRFSNPTLGGAGGAYAEYASLGIPTLGAAALYNPAVIKGLNKFVGREGYKLSDKNLQRAVTTSGLLGGQERGSQ